MDESILVVEDSIDLLECICDYLKIRNFNVIATAHNGLEAVELYKQYRPNFVLTDILMPEYDGYYGIKHIKKINPEAKIVILTGCHIKDVQEKIKPLDIPIITKATSSLKIVEKVLRNTNTAIKKSIV
jgi:DNA-binding NarL/FixJ family response regulator